MKILHLTDTHYINEESLAKIPKILQDALNKQISFDEKLDILINNEDITSFDLVVITGDLVHESDDNNYKELFNRMEDVFGSIPIHYALGNHDIKSEFNKAKLGNKSDALYNYSFEYKDHHFVIIDSAKIGDSKGSTTSEQIDWLNAELKQNDLPKLIFLHHPIFGGTSYLQYSFDDNKDILEAFDKHNIKGIFNGHTHQPATHILNGIPQFTSYCFGFGINHSNVEETLEFNDMTGYTVIEVEEVLSVQPRLITPVAKATSSISRSEINSL